MKYSLLIIALIVSGITAAIPAWAQIGTRFPSERKVITDPVTGTRLVFLTSTPAGDSKIYQTHNQWTSDGEWLIFRSDRIRGEAMAVHEKTGVMVQVTEGGYSGMINIARKTMKLYFMRLPKGQVERDATEVVEVDLEKLFNDSESGRMQPAPVYQRVCGTTPAEWDAGGEEWVWFRVGNAEARRHLPEDTKIEPSFGPRRMGAGPGGIGGMNIKTGEVGYVVSVPFQIGHIQSNPWVPGEIVFCWETGEKHPSGPGWSGLMDRVCRLFNDGKFSPHCRLTVNSECKKITPGPEITLIEQNFVFSRGK